MSVVSSAERDILSDSEGLDTSDLDRDTIANTAKTGRNSTRSNIMKSCTDRPHDRPSSPKYEDYILNNIRSLVNDDNLNDVTFIVEDEELHGIRSLFASQSIVFRQMLYGSMMESKPGNYVILNDLTVDAFKYLRNTFYNLFDSKLTSSIVVDVLFAAQKYLISPLITKCITHIKTIECLNDWFMVLHKFEASSFQLQSKIYLNQILNQGDTPHILQYKSLKFVQDHRFKHLKRETIIISIDSDYLGAKESDIWESLLLWSRTNVCDSSSKRKFEFDDLENDEKDREDSENELINGSEKELMDGFLKYIRFNQMEAMYFKENIVDKMVLPADDIISIMFARENCTKWKSSYNDRERIKSKTMDTFELNEVCLTLSEIEELKVGDLIDFRDFYGLFCPASIIEIEHNDNKIKIHYNSWGSTYDEWYNYVAINHNDNDDDTDDESNNNDDMIRLTQSDKNGRIAKYGSITARKIKRVYFRSHIDEFTNNRFAENNGSLNHEVQVQLPNWFWKKNESYIENKHLYMTKWLNAKIIGYKTAAKYSDHVKIGIYIHDDHFEYWLHPDNNQEIRPFIHENAH